MYDAPNIVLTCNEVERKLCKHHICFVPQDDNTIQVWLLVSRDLGMQCHADAVMQCANVLHSGAINWIGTERSAHLTAECAWGVHAEANGR